MNAWFLGFLVSIIIIKHPVKKWYCNVETTYINKVTYLFKKNFLSLFILRECKQGRGRKRKSQAGSILSVQSLMWGSSSLTRRSWPELKSRIGCLTDWAPGAPLNFFLTSIYFCEREHEPGVAERGRHRTWSRLQALSCQDRAQLLRGSNSTNHEIMTWAEVRRLIHWATQAPPK